MQDMREEIKRVAFELFLRSGQQQGHDLDNWILAEALVFSWNEPDEERDKHIGTTIPDDHVILPTHDEIKL